MRGFGTYPEIVSTPRCLFVKMKSMRLALPRQRMEESKRRTKRAHLLFGRRGRIGGIACGFCELIYLWLSSQLESWVVGTVGSHFARTHYGFKSSPCLISWQNKE